MSTTSLFVCALAAVVAFASAQAAFECQPNTAVTLAELRAQVLATPAATLSNETSAYILVEANMVAVGLLSDATLVAAVNAQNARNDSLAVVLEKDQQWKEGNMTLISSVLDAAVSTHLASLVSALPGNEDGVRIPEAFVTDNLGSLVASTTQTSDYWQGDESKFTGAFADCVGAFQADAAEPDESTGEFLQHVSFPIIDAGDDAVKGVIVLGVNLGRLGGSGAGHVQACGGAVAAAMTAAVAML